MQIICRNVALGAAMLGLVACGSKSASDLPPTCPVMGVLSDAAIMRFYQEGSGREQADVAYEIEFIRGNLGECKLDDGKLVSNISFDIVARKGPAVSSDKVAFDYFISVLGPDGKVVSKQVIGHVEKFKSKPSEIRFSIGKDDVALTPPEGKDGLGYEILVGFQLTREQLELNRARNQPPEKQPDVMLR